MEGAQSTAPERGAASQRSVGAKDFPPLIPEIPEAVRLHVITQTSARPRRSVSGIFVGRFGAGGAPATVLAAISLSPGADLDSVAGWEFVLDQQRSRFPHAEIVGWYRGEPRGSLAVSFRDIRLFDKAFRGTGGFGLLLGLEAGGTEKLLMPSGGHLVEVAVRGTGQPGWRDLVWRPPGTAVDGFAPRPPIEKPTEAVALTDSVRTGLAARDAARRAPTAPFPPTAPKGAPPSAAPSPFDAAPPARRPRVGTPTKRPQPVASAAAAPAGLAQRAKAAATKPAHAARSAKAGGSFTSALSKKENLGLVGSSLALLGAIMFALLTSNTSTSPAAEQSATARVLAQPAAVASATGLGARQVAAKAEQDRLDQVAADRRAASRRREVRQQERRAAQRSAARRARAAAAAAATPATSAAPRAGATTRAAAPVYTPPANSSPSPSSGSSSSPGQAGGGSGGSGGANPGSGTDVAVAPPSQ